MSTDTTPRFIPGIYNWCDRWCERCRFRTRCLTAAMHDDMEKAEARGEEFSTADWLDKNLEPHDGRPGLDAVLEAANRPLTEVDLREMDARENELLRRLEADALALDAREYGLLAHRIATALRADLAGHGDAVVLTAIEAIHRQALCISAKAHRAISGELRSLIEGFEEDDPTQSDSNGTAKIARLMIAESRDCWTALMQVGRATADGVPLKMIERLDRLDRDLAVRFPRAMEFIRPGFDA